MHAAGGETDNQWFNHHQKEKKRTWLRVSITHTYCWNAPDYLYAHTMQDSNEPHRPQSHRKVTRAGGEARGIWSRRERRGWEEAAGRERSACTKLTVIITCDSEQTFILIKTLIEGQKNIKKQVIMPQTLTHIVSHTCSVGDDLWLNIDLIELNQLQAKKTKKPSSVSLEAQCLFSVFGH